ncbi:hypothetical protein QBC39DRAFT_129744 [Podospora conica]|nr:hypothetical protein QBC39DRAFT_129744 [Schizothecium conicum]
MATGTLEEAKEDFDDCRSSGPAVWQFGMAAGVSKVGRDGEKDAEICCNKDLQEALPPPDPTSQAVERLKNPNCQPVDRPHLAPGLVVLPARLIRSMAPMVPGPPRPHVNRPPNAKHFPIEPDETNGEGRDNKVKTPDGPLKSYTGCAIFFRPIFVRVNSKTTQPTVAIRARLQRTRRAEAHAKSLRLATPTPSTLRHLHHAPPPRVVRLPVRKDPSRGALTAFSSQASRPRLCRPKPKEIAGAGADADARSSGTPPPSPHSPPSTTRLCHL